MNEQENIKKEKNIKKKVLADIFRLKCELMWTRTQILDYLQKQYGYTYETSKTYYEDMMQDVKKALDVDYEADLAQTLEFIDRNIQTLTSIDQSFTKLQWLKERNKIIGLQINRIQVDGQINHINTIKLIEHQPIKFELPEAEKPLVIPIEKFQKDEPIKVKSEDETE